jgi:hypothetical protein
LRDWRKLGESHLFTVVGELVPRTPSTKLFVHGSFLHNLKAEETQRLNFVAELA